MGGKQLIWNNVSGATEDSHWQYDDAGQAVKSQDPTGIATNAWTVYGHDSTDTYVTGVTPPTPSSNVSLPTSATYDPNAGLLTNTTDPNGTVTKYSYNSMLQVSAINTYSSQGGQAGEEAFNYTPTQLSDYLYQNASVYQDTEILHDGYGRQSRVAIANGQGTNPWYQTDTCYNSMGEVGFQSYPYQSTGFTATKVCSGSGDSYTYDAIGRPIIVIHGDGTSVSYSYTGRATNVIDENGASRITQLDGLGRLTAVCEVSSSTLQGSSPAPCGLDIPATGFLTGYSYDLLNHKTTVTQGQQTRIFQTDSLGRTVLTQEPERGLTTYSYTYSTGAGLGLAVTRKRPKANQTSASVLTTTTSQYDSLGRVVSVSYSDGTPTKNFYYDHANMYGGASAGASKGKLTEHSVNVDGNWAGTAYQYNAVGNVTATDQCLPSGCGNPAKDKWTHYTYDWLGNTLSAGDGAGVTTYYNNYSPANEVRSITSSLSDSTHPGTLVSSVVYGPNGPSSYQLGNGLTSVLTYDSLGRRNGGWVCKDSSQPGCSGGTQLYGFSIGWKGVRNSGLCDTSLNRCENFGYDEFNRLTSQNTNSGTPQNYTWVYDRYGNRWQQNPLNGGNSSQLSFNTANNQINDSGFSYDAAGNLLADGVNKYTYDAEGNVVQEQNSSTTSTFTYDALNHQVRTDGYGTAWENVMTLAGKLGSVWWATGAEIMGKAYWGAMPLDSVQIGAGKSYFQHFDWEMTKRMTTDNTGAVYGTYTSLPFGDGWANVTGSSENSYDDFAELWSNGSTDHAQFREYNNLQGRWHSPDPYSGSYDFTNPQSLNRYAYALNNPLSFTDPTGQECVWDDGSYDSADDPNTGSADKCSGQGGTWVDPNLFENAILSSGQWRSNYGDWSGEANADLAANWLAPTATINSIPTQNGTFTMNMDLPNFISIMQQSGFYLSDMDQVLSNHHLTAHNGIQMRQDTHTCGLHVNINRNSGQNGKPVTGDFHFDIVNPNPENDPADSLITTPIHGVEAGVDIVMTKVRIPGTIGDAACPNY